MSADMETMRRVLLDLYRSYRPWYDDVHGVDHERGHTALEVLEPLMKAAGLPRPDDWPDDFGAIQGPIGIDKMGRPIYVDAPRRPDQW